MGGTDSEPRTSHGSISPRWLEAQERGEADKLLLLKSQVQQKRSDVFAEAGYGSREKQFQNQAMVNAYDVVLRLIEEVNK